MPRVITELGLATSNKDFHKLWEQVYANRSDVATTVVDKKALMNLLYDHSQMVGWLQEDFSWLNVKILEGDRDAQEEAFLALKQYRDIVIEKQIDLNSNFVTPEPKGDFGWNEKNIANIDILDEVSDRSEEVVTENDAEDQT